MTDLKRRLVTSIATGAILINALAPLAFADTTITVSGNGSDSNNNVSVTSAQQTTVTQSNNANVTNNVSSNSNSGDNKAKDNTGGNVSIDTGNASTNTSVSNTLNSNTANVNCGCDNGNTTVNVSGNGSDSNNKVNLTVGGNNTVTQTNTANVRNNVDSRSNTGGNEAKDNTNGTVSISTGDASTTTNVSTTANANVANVGTGSGHGGSLSVMILGNGSDSYNSVKVLASESNTLTQSNNAYVDNYVDSSAKTGNNEAKDNTGGNVSIDTGDASNDTTVDTAVNFNWADLNCGCLIGDVTAKIAGNGEDSYNKINATVGGSQVATQTNTDNTHNDVDSNAKSGYNKAEDNTGGMVGDDPSIDTGNADSSTNVSNSGNVNALNPTGDITLPDFDFHTDFSVVWAEFWAWFSSHS